MTGHFHLQGGYDLSLVPWLPADRVAFRFRSCSNGDQFGRARRVLVRVIQGAFRAVGERAGGGGAST